MRVHPTHSIAGALLVGGLLVLAACGDDPSPTTTPTTTPTTAPTTTLATGDDPTIEADDGDPGAGADASPWPTELGDQHQRWTIRVLARIPHDPDAFTQGLEVDQSPTGDATLLESTGRRTQSTLRRLDLDGTLRSSVDVDPTLFGEGLTVVGDEILQLTLDAGLALRYDRETFDLLGSYDYEGAGWGICHGDDGIWMSNGSPTLTRRDPLDFEPIATVQVERDGAPVEDLNELECVGDHVVANVWKSDEILVIDPATGVVAATIDAGALSEEIGATDDQAVLNGIADLGDGTLLLGGKLWPTFFVVEVVTA